MAKITAWFDNSSLPIALKWSLMIACFITIVMSILGWFLSNQQKNFHQKQTQVLGHSLVNQLALAASEPILAQDELALSMLLKQEGKEQLIIGTQIFDKKGLLKASTGVSTIWDIRSLLQENAEPDYLIWQTPGTQAITFHSLIKYQDLIVGVALVTIDREPLQQQLQQMTNLFISTTVGLVFISILFAFPLAYTLSAPIRHLEKVVKTLNQDDTPAVSKTRRKDEIGRVLDSFHYLADSMEKKKQVESAFHQFLSPSIARNVLNQPQGTQLGGTTTTGSVLFCDVVGYTEISESLMPDEVGSLLNQYFKYFSLAAHSCHGTVDKFIGDCMMIIFGVPESDQQHAIHAVTCAVLIQKIATQINIQRQLNNMPIVRFRIGINSGEMLAGNLGSDERMQFTVVGDAVNLSSRVCTLCEPGQILVTRETLREPGFSNIRHPQSLGTVFVKGRKKPVYPYSIDVERFIREGDIDDYIKQILIEGEIV